MAASVPPWVIAYSLALIFGLIVGLLLRFIIALIAIVAVVFVLAIWVIGLSSPAALSQLTSWSERFLGGLPIGPQMLFTLAAVVFMAGVFVGLLLTSRLRALDRPRAG